MSQSALQLWIRIWQAQLIARSRRGLGSDPKAPPHAGNRTSRAAVLVLSGTQQRQPHAEEELFRRISCRLAGRLLLFGFLKSRVFSTPAIAAKPFADSSGTPGSSSAISTSRMRCGSMKPRMN
jgi:hypothetical protein